MRKQHTASVDIFILAVYEFFSRCSAWDSDVMIIFIDTECNAFVHYYVCHYRFLIISTLTVSYWNCHAIFIYKISIEHFIFMLMSIKSRGISSFLIMIIVLREIKRCYMTRVNAHLIVYCRFFFRLVTFFCWWKIDFFELLNDTVYTVYFGD
jgi:hypothetical protein